jgi:hypothetical protein
MYCVKFEAERVKEVWILVKDLIQKACDYSDGFADAEDFKKWLEQGTMQLWVAWDNEEKKVKCVCITEVKQYPKYKVCGCKITTGSSFKQWVDFMDYVMEWAKEEGCRKMEIHTRPGWERILKPKGFFKTHVQLERML